MRNQGKFLFQFWKSFVLAVLILTVSSCGSDPEPQPEPLLTGKVITSFKIAEYSTEFNASARTINVIVPALTDVTQLAPVIQVSEGAVISPASGVAQDFTNPVVYTVTAQNEIAQQYTVTVNYFFGLKEFKLKLGTSDYYPAVIDHKKLELVANVSLSYFRTWILVGGVVQTESTLLSGHTISPASGTTIDIDHPAKRIVTNAEGDLSYDVIIRNNDNAIENFELLLPGVTSNFTLATNGKVRVLSTDNLSSLTAKIRISERATISPSPETPQNFNNNVTYDVTSESGKKSSYNLSVIKRSIIFPNDQYDDRYSSISTSGSNFFARYRSISELQSVRLMSVENSTIVTCTITKSIDEGENYVIISPQSAVPAGKYRLEATLANGEVILTNARYVAQ